MTKTRKEVMQEDKWNVEGIYETFEAWQNDYNTNFPEEGSNFWKELTSYQGTLGKSPEKLKEAIELTLDIGRKIEKLYTYAHLRHDEDITNNTHQIAYKKMLGCLHEYHQNLSWFVPELLALPQDTINTYLKSPVLKDYHFYLEKTLRQKEHTLNPENEMILALAGKALESSHRAFSAINDADFKFGTALDQNGKEQPITHASYAMLMRQNDRILRKNAFLKYHSKYQDYENTLTELLNGTVQNHLFNARARKYASCMQASLFPHNIEPTVYHALIEAVNENLDALHKYMDLRKKVMGVKELHLYDLYVPLTQEIDITMSYDEAENAVIEAVAPLGSDYQKALSKGLKEQRWVDRYENQNKRSGAYSSGCYDTNPYILMNYKELLRDVFTLAHEAGHSMHSLLSHTTQPYQYGDYPIFLAEVASTFNEDLLTRYLLKNSKNVQERIFLINQKIEDIRSTLFRQTMFAEFELKIHTFAEKNIPITPTLLKEEFTTLNKKYFGSSVVIDPEIEIEWARIPHFYYNFYVYQYATGISAALSLSDRVINGGEQERENYLSFLKGGSSKYPIELLQIAGVDMRTKEPVTQAIGKFRELVEELENLLSEQNLAVKS